VVLLALGTLILLGVVTVVGMVAYQRLKPLEAEVQQTSTSPPVSVAESEVEDTIDRLIAAAERPLVTHIST
jgi:hypothetical protein